MSQWTEGVCGDGAAILRDGEMVPITELLAILNARQWQPIETAPHETAVLLYCPPSYPSAVCMEVAYASSGREWPAPGGGRYSTKSWHPYATHWMPLPDVPEVKP
jgi:hypothetical protein